MSARTDARVAVLDGRFTAAATRWPALWIALQERLLDQLERADSHAGILTSPRAEQRVLDSLWLVADRIGVVRHDGVHVELPLSHADIGELIGAKRPTVTIAVSRLAECGLLHRTEHGWCLTLDQRGQAATSAVPRETLTA